VLIVLGVAATVASGTLLPVPVGLVVLGAVLGLVAAVDYPRHTRFDDLGILRVCALRSQRLPWSDVVAIERTPRTTAARLRALRGDGE
jgi:hypothetical protein